ncbi:MAG: Rne/Rng family ribonuclease [Pseudomonadota bacterium]
MLIDATHPEETRVVVMDGTKVDEFDFESINKRQLAGNIYLAKVTRVEPSLQAAFVEYGGNRHGFLAFSEIHPDYYQIPVADREALLAAEAAAEKDQDEEEANEAKKPRSRRSRSRKKKDDDGAAQAVEATEVDADGDADRGSDVDALEPAADAGAGSDIVSVPEDGGGAPATETAAATDMATDTTPEVEEAEAPAAEDAPTAPVETAAAESEATPDAEQDAAEAPAEESVDVAAAEAPADDAAPEAAKAAPTGAGLETASDDGSDAGSDDEPDGDAPPKSIAESAGADEGESVSEPLDDAPAADDAPAPTAIEERAAEPEEQVTEDAPDAPEVDATEGETATADEGAAEAEAETSEADAADAADADGEKPRSKRSRSRSRSRGRGKSKKPDDGEADAEAAPQHKETDGADSDDDNEDKPDDVESVGADRVEDEVRPRRLNHRRYKIQEVIKVRQILLVQVVKEERGNKGAALTTYLSLAGRYCVLMPNTARGGGISRKITLATDRKKLKEIAGELEVPKGMGLIIRTAGAKRTKTEIKRDYEFLLRQWDQVRELTFASTAPTLIYEEGSLIKRSIRDLYGREIDSILVEGEDAYREAKDYMKMLMPSHAKNVQPYRDTTPLFSKFSVETFLAAMFNPTVQLKSGGYIVIGVTEALVAIDVNSGRSTREHSIEETALKTNLEASDEVARQLRLRDLAGLIVIDYIDMDENRNNRAVEKRMKDRLKDDRARIQVGRISAFGLMEMSRQRLRPGMLEATTAPCPHCHGTGIVRSADNVALAILREVEEEGVRRRVRQIKVHAPVAIANYIMNAKRAHVASIEQRYDIEVHVEGDASLISPDYKIEKVKGANRPRREEPTRAVSAETAFEELDAVEDAEIVEVEEPAAAQTAPTPAPDANGETDAEGRNKRRRRGKRGGRKRRRSEDG